MNKKLTRNLQIGYGISLLMLTVMGAFCYGTIDKFFSTSQAVEKSQIVLKKLEHALSLMKGAETDQRGYLLSGQPQFLEPYSGSQQSALLLIDEIQKLENGPQQQLLNNIRQILIARMKILEIQIGKRKQGIAITNEDLNAGKKAMDELRSAIAEAENKEQGILRERIVLQKRYATLMPWLIGMAIGITIVIAIWSYIQVIADLRQKDKIRADLFVKEQETAAYNEELTAANEELTAINEELAEAQQELALSNDSLEKKVSERTCALAASEEETQALNEELSASNEELAATNEELIATNEDLAESRMQLVHSLDQLKLAKADVEKREKLFRTIAQNIPGSLVMVMDRDQRLLTVEGDASLRMGYQQENYTGRKISEVMPAERYQATRDLYAVCLAGNSSGQNAKVVMAPTIR